MITEVLGVAAPGGDATELATHEHWPGGSPAELETILTAAAADRGAAWFRHKLRVVLSGIANELAPRRS